MGDGWVGGVKEEFRGGVGGTAIRSVAYQNSKEISKQETKFPKQADFMRHSNILV